MKTLLEVTLDDRKQVRFHCPAEPADCNLLFNQTFVSLIFYPDIPEMERAVHAIRLLAMAEVCACKQPLHALASIHRDGENLIPVAKKAIQEMNKQFAGKGAVIK